MAGICFNCLRPGHTVTQCQSGTCRKCSLRHNTLLHQAHLQARNSKQTFSPEQAKQNEESLKSCHITTQLTQVLLSTAVVDIISPNGMTTKCRALIDNGSQSCFMTENIAKILSLRRSNQDTKINGIDQCQVKVTGAVQATVRSCVSNYQVKLSFLVVPKITGQLPTHKVGVEKLRIPKHIALADPSFHTPSRIDLLLGQEIFLDLLCIGQLRTPGIPTLQKTRLGWIVGGRYETAEAMKNSVCHLSTVDQRIDQQLQAFWKLEEPATKNYLTSSDSSCEAHYIAHTRRDTTGRYVVSIPLKEDPSVLGESRHTALKRLEQVEKKLSRNPELSAQYNLFMKEYLELGHMEEVVQSDYSTTEESSKYFLPHHPVIKEDSSTTKLRVVFDASAKTTSGKSLNDIQLIGPTVQSDLFSILLRFRMFTFVMTTDLEKMFRQIEIEPSQRSLLQIVWRDDKVLPVKTYRLRTVTYGTASAPYLATRTLNQLATDEESNFPQAADVLRSDFYVDDLLTGTHTIEEGLELQRQLIEMLKRGHFNLRKWNANSEDLPKHLPDNLLERRPQQFSESSDSVRKTLGLWCDAQGDEFQFKYSPSEQGPHHWTKRLVLSEIARLFDPLGLVSPVVVRAKMQLQELWKLQLNWDESLPIYLHTQWDNFSACLNDLNCVSIKRSVTLPDTSATFELHCFCDASQRAYGGAVYIRHIDSECNIKVSLLCAKSRVAPLKTISIPRLELCAAVLLCKLTTQVTKALRVNIDKFTYWTDSTIVISWLNSEPARWNTFVANRVSRIQDATQQGEWKHVRTEDNPADLISRGAQTRTLVNSRLWWEGPEWLKYKEQEWPTQQRHSIEDTCEEIKTKVATFTCTQELPENDDLHQLINKHSSFTKINRVLSYCRRFVHNLQRKKVDRITGALTLEEIDLSRTTILKFIQQAEFRSELRELENGRMAPKNKLMSLSPFLDRDGLIRVGGRLTQSNLTYDQKHQILLPKNNRITEMIAAEEHVRHLHCGPQALLYAIRQLYWPINGRALTRKITHKCMKCFKVKPKQAHQLMGTLPSYRVNPGRAFCITGVDYCGPFYTKHSRRRGIKANKTYVAVFVCLATKAMHLEMVSDLTTESFLGALRRFIARRGVCIEIHSDNGKNFIGANRQLQDLRDFFLMESSVIIKAAAAEGIKWRFIPPYAPHMGGIWEAAVRSLKHHLARVIATATLTYEEFNTLLTQVEAVLNSRPLSPLSNNPTDLSVLTPGHFLIGSSLKALPEPSLMQLPENRLSRWQHLQRILQDFWSRWSSEYLSNLQQRGKWKTPSPSLQVGTLVLLKEENVPPLSWPKGRIITCILGRTSW